MNWWNLKKNKCPKCGKDTALKSPYNFIPETKMFTHPCGFKISKKRYTEIVTKMTDKEIDAIRGEENG